MKIKSSPAKVICKNRNSRHNYFAWPTVGRLRNGKLAVVASGFRTGHVCPFGKSVICFSENEGETWTPPAVLIDTPLDDRDSGIMAFGESSVIVTSFTNGIDFQRWTNESEKDATHKDTYAYIEEYLKLPAVKEGEDKFFGSTCVISNDNGVTWSDVIKLPVAAPHGPCRLNDGTLLFFGVRNKYGPDKKFLDFQLVTTIECHRIFPDGRTEFVCEIENVPEALFTEPHAVQLSSGKIIVHIRAQKGWRDISIFSVYQCESDDLSKGFTTPHRILPPEGGAPSHLIELSNGMLMSTYSYRKSPFAIKAMFSKDEGKTWDYDNVVYQNPESGIDMGYPTSVELSDGKILTTFYSSETETSPKEIMQTVWSYEE